MAGRLGNEASAYLRQHAGNPVDWWPFGDEAFAEARRRNVPVFVSIGYAACHWCHVMAHESFEDPATAEYLNQNFVSIKVDREERPDVDAVYMAATQAMTGQGGWPMSVFTLPDGRTFYAGTYFSPRRVQGLPSFPDVLEAVSSAYRDRPAEVEQSAAQLATHLASAQQGNRRLLGPLTDSAAAGMVPAPDLATGSGGGTDGGVLSAAVETLAGLEDRQFGGFGGAPKFPPSTTLRFLLAHARSDASTAAEAAALADRTLGAMARSALYDQLEGGFARYTVDRRWAVPHFEKMLYDNAQLLGLYAQWARTAGSAEDRRLALRVTRETAGWLVDRLRVDGGGLASSLDADTIENGHRVEGGTYVWTLAQLREVLGAAAGGVEELLDLQAGNLGAHGGKPGPDGVFGSTLHFGRPLDPAGEDLWLGIRAELLAARNRRPQPERDSKVVAGWNGLAVASLAAAAVVLGDAGEQDAARRARQAAEDAAGYLLRVHRTGTTLRRVSHNGSAQGIEGLLEDYAGVAEGLFALYAATGNEDWYTAAESLVRSAQERFLSAGVLQDTAIRPNQLANAQGAQGAADPMDGPAPSGTALFAGVLLTYSAYSGSLQHRALAQRLLAHVEIVAPRAPQAVGWALSVLQALQDGPRELAVTGTDAASVHGLLRSARDAAGPVPVLAFRITPEGDGKDGIGTAGTRVPLLEGREPGSKPAVAYLCRGMVCRRPVTSAQELTELLAEG
ncbi:thioredoxin domain-containing protein [Arthrobacter jiangjiafuii]|uniref:Thioredoxin domain-containing protein n=1 Tax=Arthrobacter jiangjiafuii TaxID=2817475 RepID=A0A975M6K6_9MICC|nr:thioredoxin domain-containing protein [Arthrobacter jiangjiafuii]MBP3043908.1 thioredoxin domain-containing protein [Arthrobacter jiangjiafuii]QWC10913.1 thioredoxin domain-containing protein [Arthrobacter jiangjiafuii]